MEPKAQEQAPATGAQFTLPVLVFGITEVRRLKRELEALDEFIREASIREAGKQPSLPRLSRLLDALATENHLNLLLPADRQHLQAFLVSVEHDAPTIHVSFASDPSSAFTAKIVAWLRAGIHPHILLQVGLQPTIAAGCVVRTDNHVFDFSLRERFTRQEAALMQALAAPESQVEVTVPQAPAAGTAIAGAPGTAGSPVTQNPQASVSAPAQGSVQPPTIVVAPGVPGV